MEKQLRGFASLSPDQRKKIAAKGGRAAHALGVAHEWDVEAARAAGRKGGLVRRPLQTGEPWSKPFPKSNDGA